MSSDPYDPVSTTVRPPFDPELGRFVEAWRRIYEPLSSESLPRKRASLDTDYPGPDLTAGGTVKVEERLVAGPVGCPEVPLFVLSPKETVPLLPCIYFVHGGAVRDEFVRRALRG